MPYILCNGDNYLVQDSYGTYIVNTFQEASRWDKIEKARHVQINVRNKFNRYHLDVKYVSAVNDIAPVSNEDVKLDCDILQKIREICEFVNKMEMRKMYLIGEIQKANLEIVDIEHAAEFYNLNASQGYRIYKMLHDVRNKRREMKDECTKIEMVLGTSMKKANLENLEKSILGLGNRKYTPRVNAELFNV